MRCVFIGAALLLAAGAATGGPEASRHRILIELYTSQGCTSCPRAEEFLARIAESDLAGRVVLLAWHVDYNDYLGWKDLFAVKAHTERQKVRAKAAKVRTSLATPLTIVDSVLSGPGWDSKAREEVMKPAAVAIEAEIALAGTRLTAKVRLKNPEPALPAGALVRPVLFQRQAITTVTSGENAGKRLVEHFAVRGALDPVPAEQALAGPVEFAAEIPANVLPEDLGLAVLVEEAETLATIEAASFEIVKPLPGLILVVDPDKTRGPKVKAALEREAADRGFIVAHTPTVFANDRALDYFLAKQAKAKPFHERRVILLGFSTAGKEAWAFALKYRTRVAGLALVAAPLALDAAEAASLGQGVPVLMVYGRDDKAAPAEEGDEVFRTLLGADVVADWALLDVADSFAVLNEGLGRIFPWAAKQTGRAGSEGR
ncbi:MAG: DUF1223 domain-containing protein [Planctomycetes bacterium]|jgi:hypothetical protein|nr:DUF1223 domain-containing protein [Planctomycetota bacterium]